MEIDFFERRKIRIEELKDFKIEAKVFDERTLFCIYKLMKRGLIKSVESKIKEGKESVILSGLGKEGWIAIKVYRTYHCDFRNMWKYLIADPRFFNVKKRRRQVVINWVRREFKNLKIAFEAGINCPKPFGIYENVLVMSFIGKDGKAAPRMVDLEDANWNKLYELTVNEMKKLTRAKLVHADLSAFNILVLNETPYLIDFSQAVTFDHPLAFEFLKRDVENINKFFKKKGVKVNELLFEDLTK